MIQWVTVTCLYECYMYKFIQLQTEYSLLISISLKTGRGRVFCIYIEYQVAVSGLPEESWDKLRGDKTTLTA